MSGRTIPRRQGGLRSRSTIFLLYPLPPPPPPFIQASFPRALCSSRALPVQSRPGPEELLGHLRTVGAGGRDKVWVQGPGSHAGELAQRMSAARGPLRAHVLPTRARAQTSAGRGVHCPPPLHFTVALESVGPTAVLSAQARQPGAGTGQAVPCPLDPESPSLWSLVGGLFGFLPRIGRSLGSRYPDSGRIGPAWPAPQLGEEGTGGKRAGGVGGRHLHLPS